jgi:hypothetical protein
MNTIPSTPRRASVLTLFRFPLSRSLTILVLLTAGLAGCGDDPAGPTDTTSAVAGHIRGKIVDSRGQGLSGATVYISTVPSGGGGVTVVTATTTADGTYDAALPDGLYGVLADYTTTYTGRQYREFMSPDDGINGDKVHDSRKGYVKNFTWKISGEIPGVPFVAGEAHHYGGYVDLGNQAQYNEANREPQLPEGEPIPLGSTVEIRLTPDGPLLDGSQGQVVTRTHVIGETFWYNKTYDLMDIPLGRYTVSAVLIEANGNRRNLRVSTLPGRTTTVKPTAPGATSVLEFWPVDFSTATHGTWGTYLYLLM